ncbi:MAG TPA: prephenate dehydratase, partial [Marinilabiliaceae bacterium]|nr:prephenate dehydratase [Marinilabiliaceae bacterium]
MSQQTVKVAIQGWPGANHDIAARAYFSDKEVILEPCMTFFELFQKLAADSSMIGMVAIENTLVGSLLSNYTLLKDS